VYNSCARFPESCRPHGPSVLIEAPFRRKPCLMPAPPLRRRRRPFARSAAQTTSRRPARSRIPPATGAARRAVRSGTSTGCSRQTATAAAAEDGAEGRDPPGLARKAGAAPDSARRHGLTDLKTVRAHHGPAKAVACKYPGADRETQPNVSGGARQTAGPTDVRRQSSQRKYRIGNDSERPIIRAFGLPHFGQTSR